MKMGDCYGNKHIIICLLPNNYSLNSVEIFLQNYKKNLKKCIISTTCLAVCLAFSNILPDDNRRLRSLQQKSSMKTTSKRPNPHSEWMIDCLSLITDMCEHTGKFAWSMMLITRFNSLCQTLCYWDRLVIKLYILCKYHFINEMNVNYKIISIYIIYLVEEMKMSINTQKMCELLESE